MDRLCRAVVSGGVSTQYYPDIAQYMIIHNIHIYIRIYNTYPNPTFIPDHIIIGTLPQHRYIKHLPVAKINKY